jgi:hypothetical protein
MSYPSNPPARRLSRPLIPVLSWTLAVGFAVSSAWAQAPASDPAAIDLVEPDSPGEKAPSDTLTRLLPELQALPDDPPDLLGFGIARRDLAACPAL